MYHYRLFYPRQTCLLSVQHEGKSNVTVVDWVSPASVKPPMVVVALNQKSFSLELVESSKAFVISTLPEAMMEKAMSIGSATGRVIDKVDEYQLTLKPAKTVKAPLVDGAFAWVECELVAIFNAGDHALVVGEVLETHFPDDENGKQAMLFNWGSKNYFGMRREMVKFEKEEEKRPEKKEEKKEEEKKPEKKEDRPAPKEEKKEEEKKSEKKEDKPSNKEEPKPAQKDSPKEKPAEKK